MITYPSVKINLGLNVLRKRPDGYHDIETAFVPYFDIHDTLEIISGDDYSQTSAKIFAKYSEDEIQQGITEDGKLMITIACSDGVSWDPLMDLTSKAYMLLAADFKMPSIKIFLEKTSPVGAGLGGGSSDAAFALKMLNDIFLLNLSDVALADYASRLGSDCAFFIYNKPMLGTGRGEVLTPFDLDLGGAELKVLVPEGVAVSTAEAYSGIVPKEPVREISDILKLPIGQWKDLLVNDFEATVFVKHPELAAIKTSLYESGAVYASMSGSGSAIFGIYK